MDLDWKMRALRILPMFLLPALSSVSYSAFVSFTRMRKYLNFTSSLLSQNLSITCPLCTLNLCFYLSHKTSALPNLTILLQITLYRVCCSFPCFKKSLSTFSYHVLEYLMLVPTIKLWVETGTVGFHWRIYGQQGFCSRLHFWLDNCIVEDFDSG